MSAITINDKPMSSTDSPTDKTPVQRSSKYYKYISDHDDLESAIMVVLNGFGDGIEYKPYKHTPTASGSTHWYRCSFSRLYPLVQIKHNTTTDLFVVLRDEAEHEHSKTSAERPGLDPIVKKYVDGYERLKLKPSAMLKALRNEMF